MKQFRLFGLLVVLALAILFPIVFSDPTVTTVAIFALFFAGFATSWNIFSGYTGYISLGHTAFYGLGAYTLALVCQDWHIQGGYTPFLLLPLAGLVAAIGAVPIGWIALRTKRQIFVVITLAFFSILQLLTFNLQGFTNGSSGIFLPNPPWAGDFFNIPFYYVLLAVLCVALLVSWFVRNSKYGLGLLAIRDDEERALSLGVKTELSKLSAYVISAFFVGMLGATIAYFDGAVYPQFAFDPSYDVFVALMVLCGGIGTLSGPILGALLLVPLQQYLTIQLGENGLDLVFYGALLLIVIFLLPQGIIPTLRKRWLQRKAMREVNRMVISTVVAPSVGEATLTEKGEG